VEGLGRGADEVSFFVRKFALILFLFAAVSLAGAAETNYFCVICGKGPLYGRIWVSQWGPVCDDCYRLPDHCSLCGLPIRDGDGSVKTGDGRYICKFDLPDTVLDAAGAREVFRDVRRELVGLYGGGFTLNYPQVTVNLFDVDYWSEAGRADGLHKYGFASSRQMPGGGFTHEIVLLSGRRQNELAATAAHEYTHLWINENRPATHVIDGDTTEAICELSAYRLMEARSQPEQMQRILDNPYTHGEIKQLVALEKKHGPGYILNWVKDGTTPNFAAVAPGAARLEKAPAVTATNAPPPLPETLKLSGLLLEGPSQRAIINGLTFAAGETRSVKLRDRTVRVSCREVRRDAVVLEVAGLSGPFTLRIGEEKFAP
jgi:hypothetical protein